MLTDVPVAPALEDVGSMRVDDDVSVLDGADSVPEDAVSVLVDGALPVRVADAV